VKETPEMKSLHTAKSEADIIKLPRDHFDVGNWSIMTDGYMVWVSQQALGEQRTDHIAVPKTVFDKLLAKYIQPQGAKPSRKTSK
jgi:hypothetical protein